MKEGDDFDVFLSALGANVCTTSSTVSRGLNGIDSNANLPASIFEKSKISLTMVKSISPERKDCINVFFLDGIKFGIAEKVDHANDAVHGGSDFMAHVGEEICFRLGRLERGVSGQGQFAPCLFQRFFARFRLVMSNRIATKCSMRPRGPLRE
jgi:hypothetical protein